MNIADVLKQHGIETVIPNSDERDTIDNTLMMELVRGIFSEETRKIYIDIIRQLHSRSAQGVILGCTEIPLLIRPQDIDIPVFSTTEIHCKAAVEKSIGDDA